MNGLVVVDKPSGCSSHDVVNVWRKLAGTKRVGHLGTLDPMATGVLVLVSGHATRLAKFYGAHEKTYLAELQLGRSSDTYDADGLIDVSGAPLPADPAVIEGALNEFRGRFPQMPPPVSAKKVKGVAAYKLTRKKVEFELAAVEVTVSRLDLLSLVNDVVRLEIECGAGTYIRSIAHDLGQRLGCGAILTKLRRLQSGPFQVEDAHSIDSLRDLALAGRLSEAVTPMSSMLPEFAAAHFQDQVAGEIRRGMDFRTSPFVIPPGSLFVKALSSHDELIAIGELKFPNFYHPCVVIGIDS